MELILVVVISAGMAGNSQNGVSRSLSSVDMILVAGGGGGGGGRGAGGGAECYKLVYKSYNRQSYQWKRNIVMVACILKHIVRANESSQYNCFREPAA